MTSGLWPHIQEGSAAAVSAGVRVSERRSRLLGIDAAVVTKSELTGSVGVYAEKLAAERELFGKLALEQLEELAAEVAGACRQGDGDGAGERLSDADWRFNVASSGRC